MFIAWGAESLLAVKGCTAHSRLEDRPLFVMTDERAAADLLPVGVTVIHHEFSLEGKQRKLEALAAVPDELGTVLLLDADTRVLDDVSLGYEKAERHGIALSPAPHYSLADFRGFEEVMREEGVAPKGQLIYNSGVVFFDAANDEVGALFELARKLAEKHGRWSDQPFLTLAMELRGFNPYTLSPSFNHRAYGELVSGSIRVWHSNDPVPPEAVSLEPGYIHRYERGSLQRVVRVPTAPSSSAPAIARAAADRRRRPRIIVHVGAPKTGSTYLQRRLRADGDRLRRQGIYVPVLPAMARIAGNAKLLATALSQDPSLTFRRAFPEIDLAALDPRAVTDDLLADWDPERETVVLSAENFKPGHAAALRELLPAGAETTILLYVRRQDRWIESYFNQILKSFEFHSDLASFVRMLCHPRPDSDRFCCPDWLTHYESWQEHFGDCRVLLYEEVKDDLFTSFFAAAHLPVPDGIPDIGPVQVSLDLRTVAYLLCLPDTVTLGEFARRRLASERASRQLGPPPAPASLLDAASRDLLRERFEESNRRLIQALGRDYAGSPLDWEAGADRETCTLGDVYASDAFIAHAELADALYAEALREPSAPIAAGGSKA